MVEEEVSIDTGELEKAAEQKWNYDYERSANLAEDIVYYSRGRTINNEQNKLLITLAHTSSYLKGHETNVPTVIRGTSSAGKSHMRKQIDKFIPDYDAKTATSSSPKAFIDDEEWDKRKIALVDELNKVDDAIVEFFKTMASEPEFEYQRNVADGDSRSGRSSVKVKRESMNFSFMTAQWDIDFELLNRMLIIWADECAEKNRAVGAMHFDQAPDYGDGQYGYDVSNVETAIQHHFHQMPSNVEVRLPEWVFEVVAPIVDHKRSESNRIYKMIASLIRASVLLNYHERDEMIATPQDVANVLACHKALIGTTHRIDDRIEAVLQILSENAQDGRMTFSALVEKLRDSNFSMLQRDELYHVLDFMHNQYYIEKSGSKRNMSITFNRMPVVRKPNLDAKPEVGEAKDVIRNQPLKETVENFENQTVLEVRE